MAYREQPQLIRPLEFQLAVRTFIPFPTYLGFIGDNRTFSTSPSATYRSGMFIVFDLPNGRITSPLIGNSTGTRRNISDVPYIAKVGLSLKKFQGDKGRVLLEAHMHASDPYPVVNLGSPDIDTDISFTAHLRAGNLFVAGVVIGDAFPSTEVFIRDHRNQSHELLKFATPYGFSGTVRLMGVGTRNLGIFREGIMLDKTGCFIGSVPWHS